MHRKARMKILEGWVTKTSQALASLPLCTDDIVHAGRSYVYWDRWHGSMKSALLQRAVVASGTIETSQGRILPKFYLEKMWDQRMSSVLELKKIEYSRQENT